MYLMYEISKNIFSYRTSPDDCFCVVITIQEFALIIFSFKKIKKNSKKDF